MSRNVKVSLGLVVAATAASRLSERARRASIAAAILVAGGGFAFVSIDGISGEGGRHEDRGGGGSGLLHGIGNRVINRHFMIAVIEGLTALSGSDSGDEGSAVVETESGVASAKSTGNSLHQNFGVCVYENRHFVKVVGV